MLKTYTAYVVNSLNGRSRDVSIRAMSSDQARKLLEETCLKANENVICIYPS